MNNILKRFFQSKSDASPLEANQQEQLENDFGKFLIGEWQEAVAIDMVDEMAIQSLDPENFEAWGRIKDQLNNNRKILKQ